MRLLGGQPLLLDNNRRIWFFLAELKHPFTSVSAVPASYLPSSPLCVGSVSQHFSLSFSLHTSYTFHLLLSIFTLNVLREEKRTMNEDRGGETLEARVSWEYDSELPNSRKSQKQLHNNAQKIFVSPSFFLPLFSRLPLQFSSSSFVFHHVPFSFLTSKYPRGQNTAPRIFTAKLWLNKMSDCVRHNFNLHRRC